MTDSNPATTNRGGCNINTEKNTHAYHHAMASVLVASLFCSQALGQTLSASSLSIGDGQESTRVETIRLAQTDTNPNPGWLGEIDIDPPVIDHEALENGVSGESQQFSAVVVDDRGLKHVMLFYRDRAGTQYSSTDMQLVEGSDEFVATVDTSLGQTRVEYYIEALDSGGNRVLKGFPFFPLVRDLTPVTASVSNTAESTATESRLIYVILGIAAVGVALALAGGNDDSPTTTTPQPPTPGTVPLNIIVSPP